MNRRSFLKRLIAGFGGLMLLIGLDALFIERRQFLWHDMTILLPELPKAFEGMRIAHFSDMHLGHGLTAEDIKPLVSRINEARPDIVVFTGDLVDDGMEELEAAADVLAGLQAPYGKYAVLGNHDVRGKADPDRIIQAYRAAGFVPLVNEHVKITHERTGQSIWIAGLDDFWRKPNWNKTFADIPEGGCTIALIHEPDLADLAKDYGVCLQLSGHSHGGQIRFPFVGGILYPPYGRKYPDGLQKVENSSMFVHTSRGIGTTILPIRFLCRPEWHVLTLSRFTNL